jgi:hypothetical protein
VLLAGLVTRRYYQEPCSASGRHAAVTEISQPQVRTRYPSHRLKFRNKYLRGLVVSLVPGLGSPQAENGRGIQRLKEPQNLPAACEAGRLVVRRYFGPGPTTEQRYTSFVTSRVICPAAAAARTSASEVNW